MLMRGGPANHPQTTRRNMATIPRLPEYQIILGLKGTIDFACWRGQPYARSWPRPPALPRAPKVAAQHAAYGYISQQYPLTPPNVKDALVTLSDYTQRTGRDYQISLYYGYDVTLGSEVPSDFNFADPGYAHPEFS